MVERHSRATEGVYSHIYVPWFDLYSRFGPSRNHYDAHTLRYRHLYRDFDKRCHQKKGNVEIGNVDVLQKKLLGRKAD